MATQRKDGRWMARKMVAGVRMTGYGQTEEEVNSDLEAKILATLSEPSSGPVISLNDYAAKVWYPTLKQLAPLTEKRYKGIYEKYLLNSNLGRTAIEEIGTSHVKQWLEAMRRFGDNTRAYGFSVLRTILMGAYRDEYINENPCSRIKVTNSKTKRDRVLDVEEALALLEAVRGTPLSAPVYLGMVLGLRRGEVAGLRWDDLDRKKRELKIVRQRQAIRPHGVIERELKTKGSRRTLYPPQEMIEHIDARGDLDSPYICTHNGSPWVPDTISEYWANERDRLGLPDWHFHDLRHLAAGLLAAAGADLISIAAVLGQTSPNMAQVYTSVTESRRREMSEKMMALFR